MTNWQGYLNQHGCVAISGFMLRSVENQERVATNRLVSNLDEQAALEEMIEATKPQAIAHHHHVHYLLSTPFRYPPLRHGSRFGVRSQRGIFYGSLNESTVLAEDAYYRLLFRYHATKLRDRAKAHGQRTVFGVHYQTAKGIRLQAPPFSTHRKKLRSPSSYDETQRLGTAMRAAGIEAFEFESARDKDAGINVGLFVAQALSDQSPVFQHSIMTHIHDQGVDYFNTDTGNVYHYALESFLVNGALPLPAF